MSHIIGRGRYARETYPARSNQLASAGSPLFGWDRLTEDPELSEISLQDLVGNVRFRHPRSSDQANVEYLQVTFAQAAIASGDILSVNYSGWWQVETGEAVAGPLYQAFVDVSVVVSFDGGTTWLEAGLTETEFPLFDNAAEGGDLLSSYQLARTWDLNVNAAPTGSVIVGILMTVNTPAIVDASPFVFVEGEENGPVLTVVRYRAASVAQTRATTYTDVTAQLAPPPWRP